MKALNIGCGKIKLNFAVNMDIHGGDVKGDILNIPFNDKTFDWVLTSHVLEHILDTRVAMLEIHRVLNYSGILVVRVPYGLKVLFDPFHKRAFDLTTMDRFTHDDPNSLEYGRLFRIIHVEISDYELPSFLELPSYSYHIYKYFKWLLIKLGFEEGIDGKIRNPYPLTRRKEITWILQKIGN